MTATRNRSAWIWLAIAALAVASVARAEAGIESATAFANPVLHFLAGHPSTGTSAAASAPLGHSSRPHDADPGAWMAMLPVLFVGLVAPLSLISPSSVLCLGRPPAAPILPSSFQRPPPAVL